MARWEVLTRSGSVEVEGGNWLLAVGVALPALGMEPDVLGRLVCDVQSDGVVRIIDPVSRTPFLIRRLAESSLPSGARAVMPVGVVLTGGPSVEPEPEPEVTEEVDAATLHDLVELDGEGPPPALDMPSPRAASYASQSFGEARTFDPSVLDEPWAPSSAAASAATAPPTPPSRHDQSVPETRPAHFTDEHLRTLDDLEPLLDGADPGTEEGPPADLEEILFMRGMDIADAHSVDEAAETALAVLEELIPAESSSVLYAGINDTSLRFIAAHGPSADRLDEVVVPLGHGIAGFCFDNGSALVIRNAAADPRHLHQVDEATGYRTRDLLSVALRDSAGGIHGCLQLLNPQGGRFQAWHIDAASMVGSTLADFIRSRPQA